jgi:hypothetical protein
MRLRQYLLSIGVFALLVTAVVAVDSRVRDEVNRVLWGSDGVATWDDRALSATRSVTDSFQYQGIDNGPVMVFAVVGGVLFLLMLRA